MRRRAEPEALKKASFEDAWSTKGCTGTIPTGLRLEMEGERGGGPEVADVKITIV